MKILTPLFALLACIVLSGCGDEEYNETGAVPPGEADEFATGTETDAATDAVIILDETEGQTGQAEDRAYQSAKPPVDNQPPGDTSVDAAADQPIEELNDSAAPEPGLSGSLSDSPSKSEPTQREAEAQQSPEQGASKQGAAGGDASKKGNSEQDSQSGKQPSDPDQSDVVDEVG